MHSLCTRYAHVRLLLLLLTITITIINYYDYDYYLMMIHTTWKCVLRNYISSKGDVSRSIMIFVISINNDHKQNNYIDLPK